MKAHADAGRAKSRRKEVPRDLVFDFQGMGSPDLGALCLMLTARQMADDAHRRVWLRALPEPTWRLLEALGLEHYFGFLPDDGDSAD